MTRFILRRGMLLILTLLLTSAVVFALTQVLPGDIARIILGRDARPEALEALREELGLNAPVTEQYARWLTNFVTGDWGRTFGSGNVPVRPLVMERLVNSLWLALFALTISAPISVGLGILAALNENRFADSIISLLSLAVVGLPEFVTALILINVVALGTGAFPSSSNVSSSMPPGEWIRQLTLPAVTASFVLVGYIVRMTRAGVIDELKRPYVRAAELKGLSRRQVVLKHVLRNALMPTITVIAISFGWLIGRLIVIENVFNYPGIGRLMIAAVERKDIPLMQAVVMVTVFFYAAANLIADMLYAALNPRVRLE